MILCRNINPRLVMGPDGEGCKVLGDRETAFVLEQPVGKSTGAAIGGQLSLDTGHAGGFLEWTLGNPRAPAALLAPQKFQAPT